MHVVECAGGVDRYLRMLTSRMDRERFGQILVCSDDFRREEYEDFVYEFVQVHEMQNALSPSRPGQGTSVSVLPFRLMMIDYSQAHQATQVLHTLSIKRGAHQATQVSDY